MSTTATPVERYIFSSHARSRLNINGDQLARLIRMGGIRTRKLPGLRLQVCEEDIARIERESVIAPAK